MGNLIKAKSVSISINGELIANTDFNNCFPDIYSQIIDAADNLQKKKAEYEERVCKAILAKYGYPHGVVKHVNYGLHGIKEIYVREESGLVLCEIDCDVGFKGQSYKFRVNAGLMEFMK